jgi:hypothetical protein
MILIKKFSFKIVPLILIIAAVVMGTGCKNIVSGSRLVYRYTDPVTEYGTTEYLIKTNKQLNTPSLALTYEKTQFVKSTKYKIGETVEVFVSYNPLCELLEVPLGCLVLPYCWAGAGAGRTPGDRFWEKRFNWIFSCMNPVLNCETMWDPEKEVKEISRQLVNNSRTETKQLSRKSIGIYISGKQIKSVMTDSQGKASINLLEKEYLPHLESVTLVELSPDVQNGVKKKESINITQNLGKQLKKAQPIILRLQPYDSTDALAKCVFALTDAGLASIADALELAEVNRHKHEPGFMYSYEKSIEKLSLAL